MNPRKSFVAVAVGASLFAGCATISNVVAREHAAHTETMLAQAGFEILPADTPERVAELEHTPHFELVARPEGDHTVYVYADPAKCHCELVGDDRQLAAYRRLLAEQRDAYEREQAKLYEDEPVADPDSEPGVLAWRTW